MYHRVLLFISLLSIATNVCAQSEVEGLKYQTAADVSLFNYSTVLQPIAMQGSIIGLGEATHGTTEFEEIKTEIVKTLVKDYGYRHLVLEAAIAPCNVVNTYIASGNGDAATALFRYFAWPYATRGMMNMLDWLKAYNQGKPAHEQVKFYGMDIMSATNPVAIMRYELNKYGYVTGLADTGILSALDRIAGTEKEKQEAYLKLYNDYAKRSYPSQRDSLVALDIIETALSNNISHGGTRYAYREDLLFKYADHIIKELPEGEKVIIWAHNMHVIKKSSHRKSLGEMLDEKYHDKYKVIGFEFNTGSFRANTRDSSTKKYSNQIFTAMPLPDCIGKKMQAMNKGIAGISVSENIDNKLVTDKQYIHDVGAEYNYTSASRANFYSEHLILKKTFDYLFIADTSHPTKNVLER